MTDLPFRSATELTRALAAREISCRDLLELYLTRVEKHDPQLAAVVTLDRERAQRRAGHLDRLGQ